ncbi:aminotransferase class I/II-fold pyridoxal phosphate-dependent enzyme [Zooshikella marina]|uniref:aminotransferase class I/II-fold pyridoxal phosphate-dependent enzyme n=1 Tax=Zooshikella ganghwensis TaxID=202772 RepID=UPI001BB01B60|nr:aminotransferase class I/II-fold pyridoxal phosphate-dependent enzyme [Zooshikella ganghwensis]MBU2707519.1 aminotransferase class I/II-fold pyridoxal phosphate-dependent enzyme [Zooshikella ganghwensis]
MDNNKNAIERLADAKHEFGEHGGVNMSIEASSTFTVMEANTLPEIFQGQKGPQQGGCYLYGRHFNPTVYNLAQQLACIEGSESAYCTASGMAAISSTLLQLLNPGDEVIASHTIYGGTYALLHDYFPLKNNINTHFIDIHQPALIEQKITEKTKVIYVESISNPTLRVADIKSLASIAKKHQLTLVVDNTFAPLIIEPIALGADIVIHSLTKFINGASDTVAGVVCASTDFVSQLMDLHTGSLMLLGPTMDPEVAFRISARLSHLPLRIQAHSQRALYIAQQLQALQLPVTYPGLPDHPDHRRLKAIGNVDEYGFGGLLTLDLGSEKKANTLMNILQNEQHFGFMAVSLGFSDTLMSCSGSSTSSEMTEEDKQLANISPGLVRFSVGYTGSLAQRWNQLKAALAACQII